MKKVFSLRATKWIVIFALVLALALLIAPRSDAAPIVWNYSPDGNSLAFGVTVVSGLLQIGSADYPGAGSPQPMGIFGAGFTQTGTNFTMKFGSDLYTWDSYNEETVAGTGYYDAFVVTVSTAGYYWDLPQFDPILPSASTFVWGGKNYADNKLENYTTSPLMTDMITLASDMPTTFYVSLVLDTGTLQYADEYHPSWGSFAVKVVPEPGTLLLLGSGLMGLAFYARRSRLKG